MKQKFIDLYMDWAERASELSHAERLHVGAVIVKDDTVISYGYNGMPADWDNVCENIIFVPDSPEIDFQTMKEQGFVFGTDKETAGYVKRVTKPEVLHAESNAIAKLAKSSNSGLGADIFITHSPCIECAKLIFQSGIRRVFYKESYRNSDGIDFLKKSKIVVKKLGED